MMRRALEVVRAASKPLESQEIARQVFGRASMGEVLPHEGASVRRALRALAARGEVEDMGRNWARKRRKWARPEVAAQWRAWSAAFLEDSRRRAQARRDGLDLPPSLRNRQEIDAWLRSLVEDDGEEKKGHT